MAGIWAAGHELVRIDQPATLEGSVVIEISGYKGFVLGAMAFDEGGNLWARGHGLAGGANQPLQRER